MELKYDECYSYVETLSKEEIKKLGIVYTPLSIVDYINTRVLDVWKKDNIRPPNVIDFSCGSGIFLIDMVEKISKHWGLTDKEAMKCVSGCDLDWNALNIARSKLPDSNLFVADGLDVDLTGYDITVGNPPYVKIQNLDHGTRRKVELLGWTTGDYDLYIAFFERALKICPIVGYITPNSWAHTKSASLMRRWAKENQNISELVNFKNKKVFKGYDTYCSITISSKGQKDAYILRDSLEDTGEIIPYNNFNEDQFMVSNGDLQFLKEVESRTTPLFDVCSIKTGLATLADSVFILEDCVLENDHVLFEKNNESYRIEKDITFPCKRSGKIKRLVNKKVDRIIFPYHKDSLSLIKEGVLEESFPEAFSYLMKNKERLLKRDAGKVKESEWYCFGRSQGFKNNTKKLLLPTLINNPFVLEDDDSHYVGYAVFEKEGTEEDLKSLNQIFTSDDIMRWIKIHGSPKGDRWYGIKKSIFKNYKINERANESKSI